MFSQSAIFLALCIFRLNAAQNQTVGQIIKSDPQFQKLLETFVNDWQWSVADGVAKVTAFLPNTSSELPQNWDDDKPGFTTDHIVAQVVTANDFQPITKLFKFGTRNFLAYTAGEEHFFNTMPIDLSDPIAATNGNIYVIPQPLPQNLKTDVINSEVLTLNDKFMNKLRQSNTFGDLQTLTELQTLFLPSNAAIETIPSAKNDILDSNIPYLAEVVKSHVLTGKAVFTAQFEADGSVLHPTLETGKDSGIRLFRSTTLDGIDEFFVSCNGVRAKIITANIPHTNGVVHVIDSLLYYKMYTAWELLALPSAGNSKAVEVFGTPAIRAKLESNTTKLTFMPPSKDALQGIENSQRLKEHFRLNQAEILAAHIIDQTEVTLADIAGATPQNPKVVTATVNGATLTWNFFFIDGSAFVQTGVSVSPISESQGVRNGFSHTVETVLTMPKPVGLSPTKASYFGDITWMSTFADLLESYDLIATIRQPDKNFTIFVVNATELDAFHGSAIGQKVFDMTQKDRGTTFLNRHIIQNPAHIVIQNLALGSTNDFTTEAGEQISITRTASGTATVKFGNEAAVNFVLSDMAVGNAMIHLIDAPLTKCLADPTDACFKLTQGAAGRSLSLLLLAVGLVVSLVRH